MVSPVNERRQDEQDEQRQPPVHPQQNGGRQQDQDNRFHNAQHRAAGQEANPLHILHGPRQDLPGFCPIMEGKRKRRQFLYQFIAQIIGHILRDNFAPFALVIADNAGQQAQPQQDQRGSPQ